MQWKLREETREGLGPQNYQRLEEYATYGAGWGPDGRGQPLQVRSLARLERFLQIDPDYAMAHLCMDHAGCLQLAWRTRLGNLVEMIFERDGYQVWPEHGYGRVQIRHPEDVISMLVTKGWEPREEDSDEFGA